ncbi:MAG: nucleotide sugar dehydrogenase [bacterium]
MRINLFGLGYVGCVSAACLARDGHEVCGVDVDPGKVDLVNAGKSPVVEPGLDDALAEARREGRLRARCNRADELPEAEISIVCVGTPGRENGSVNLESIRKVAEQIGAQLRRRPQYHVVCIRSTTLPGTAEETVLPILERSSGKKAPDAFGLCANPEFLREGSSLFDFYHPPFTLIGETDLRAGSVIAALYGNIPAPVIRTRLRTAEMVKYASNAFHALKVCFANEIGRFCKKLGIDSHEIMDILCRDTKLNLSASYLKPGFAFGGSCLPKDLRALLQRARQLDLELPVLAALLPSNELQVREAFALVERTGKRKIGVLGMSFKPGTDDLRESPMVELIEKLIGKGYEIAIYDREVSLARLVGANKKYIELAIPHIASLMKSSLSEVLEHGEVIVIGNRTTEIDNAAGRLDPGKIILDLVRAPDVMRRKDVFYQGLCW